MSQKAIKTGLDKKLDKTSIAQELGDSEEFVMSQKAITLAYSFVPDVIQFYTETKKGVLGNNNQMLMDLNYKSKTTGYILTKPNEVYLYKGVSRKNGVGCIVFDENKAIINTFSAESEDTYTEFTMPEKAKYVRFSSFSNVNSETVLSVIRKDSVEYVTSIFKAEQIRINAELTKKFNSENIAQELGEAEDKVMSQKAIKTELGKKLDKESTQYKNVLSFKKWVACGDSFTHGDFTSVEAPKFADGPYKDCLKVYPYYIGNRIYDFDVKNIALNGLTLKDFVEKGMYKTKIPLDTNYITLYFGINDSHQNIPIGSIKDTEDSNTFYGYWNTLMRYLIENFQNAKIGIIVSNALGSSDYSNAEREISKKYGIPCLDFAADKNLPYILRQYERTDVDINIRSMRDKYFAVSSTNQHPNEKAHYHESTFIEKFLLSL